MGPEERKIFITFAYVAVFIAVVVSYFFVNIFAQQRKMRNLERETECRN